MTEEMLQDLPLIDLHVHMPGTISPSTAWKLGVKNKLISLYDNKFEDGPVYLNSTVGFNSYSDIFKNKDSIRIENSKLLSNLKYNMNGKFKSFDKIMAVVQGHRSPPGGIQSAEDIRIVMLEYMKDCISNKVMYSEILQNIKIAYNVYPELSKEEARRKFFILLDEIKDKFEQNNIHIRFLQCFNKTSLYNESCEFRAVESAKWLAEAEKISPGLFVGIESAGHEKDPSGWPEHLLKGYSMVYDTGLGCEAHAGEGIGVEHMQDVINTLPLHRLAHGFQSVENPISINQIKEKNITIISSPIININLGCTIHAVKTQNNTLYPAPKSVGGKQALLTNIFHHPIFSLIREHKVKLSICSDNPYMAGVPIKQLIGILSGVYNFEPEFDYKNNTEGKLPETHVPLSAEEVVQSLIHGIECMFCKDIKIKSMFINALREWTLKYGIFSDTDIQFLYKNIIPSETYAETQQ